MQIFIVLILTLLVPYQAEARLIDWFIPGPISLVLKVGQWLSDENKDPVYYIQVEASGDNQIQARNTAFKLAVDQAVGSVISSETVVRNGTANHVLYNYSSGYVHDYKILSTQQHGKQTRVKVDVWVKPSNIADRVLHKTENTNSLPGDTFQASISTIATEHTAGDKLLQSVLNDYPARGYNIEFQKAELLSGRQTKLNLSWKLSWNQYYLDSLQEALTSTSNKQGSAKVVWKKSRPHKGWIYNYDNSRLALLQDTFIVPWNKYIITLTDNTGNVLKSYCTEFEDQKFVQGFYRNTIHVNSYTSISQNASLDISNIDISKLARYNVMIARSCN